MLKIRIASAFVLIPLVMVAMFLGDLAFFALALIVLILSAVEFYQMAQRAGYHPLPLVGIALIALILLNTYFQLNALGAIIVAALILTMFVALFRRSENWIAGWALTFIGAFYLGGAGAYFLLVRAMPNGLEWTLLAAFSVWAGDTAAYFAGTYLGKHGFFNHVSPKKTWEGALGAWIVSTLIGGLCAFVFGLPVAHGFIAGLGLGITGAFGDLAESLIKRQFGAKDSGNLLPGHGGMLDRIDSMLFAAVFVYYYVIWFVRA